MLAPMILVEVLGVLMTVVVVSAVAVLQRRQRARRRDLGTVSDRWVAEHRAGRATD
jgi:hypothetical protein